MTAEAITAIGTVAVALVAAGALAYQVRSFRLSLSADLSMKLDARFWDEGFRSARAAAARALLEDKNTEEAEDVFDFLDSMGLFARRKAVDVEFLHSFFFHWIVLYWTAGRDHIRARQKDARLVWKDFEWLYKAVIDIEMQGDSTSRDVEWSPEKIRKFLQDEADLCSSEDGCSVP